MRLLCFVLFLCVRPKEQNGARILGIVPTPSYSHQVVFQPIWIELALRGHQLTVLTTDPINNSSLTNLKEIDLGFAYDFWNVKHNFTHMIRTAPDSLLKFIDRYVEMVDDIVDNQLAHPEVKTLIQNKSEHFDLLMLEYSFPSLTVFSERFKCPFIGMTSLEAHSSVYDSVGNPSHPVLNPDFSLPFGGSLTFKQRILSFLFQTYTRFYKHVYSYPKLDLQVRKHFGNGYLPLTDIANKVSMLFVNVNPIFHNIRPVVPAVIQIGGGTHLKTPKPLPRDLQNYLNNATEGFIYFSLGSNVKSVDMDRQLRDTILATFSELPYKVLWKFESDDLPGKPSNVYISKWFSQQDVFRHPNIKLFITQGGLQSMEEAIYNYIPLLGIPFYGDQYSNVDLMVAKGFGLSLSNQNLRKDEFKKTILEVISNPRYRNRVIELAKVALDQPMTGLQRAVWWTEYVLRHKGAQNLRSPAIDLPLYQYLMLDIIGFFFAVILVFIFISILLIRISLKIVRICYYKTKVD
ncbi:hypothetical protein RI129_010632 [Pyrocoelia pectoralis]|uniref:UDP-glucuronosyltransferase n=1 Tax=Pyrocoelia pectoralis TaxID=417401 RepID=A0AAN7V6K6_9COLE